MYNYAGYAFYIKSMLMVIIFINMILTIEYVSLKEVGMLGMCFFILINDYLRFKIFHEDDRYNMSLVLSFIGSIWLLFIYTELFFYAILFEIIVYLEGKLFKTLLIGHIVIYLGRDIYLYKIEILKSPLNSWKDNGLEFLVDMSFYMLIVSVFLYLRWEFKERIKAQNLNNELNEAYKKLREYSSEIEELTIVKERGRVASEIHDSLGHSLTALIMHLDFLENVIDKDIEKAKIIIFKSQDLARNSMDGLRRAVYALKEEIYSNGLKSAIDELIGNLATTNNIKINLNFEEEIEDISPDVKNVIYRTLQEGLTNGIKHGKATRFLIDIMMINDGIELKIKDNGNGCREIIKGNGLSNIEDRISRVHGRVIFSSTINDGFSIDVYMPLKGVEVGI